MNVADRTPTFVQRHPLVRHLPGLVLAAIFLGHLAGHLAAAITLHT